MEAIKTALPVLTEIYGYKAHVCDRCRKIVYPSRTAKKIERSIERENTKIQKEKETFSVVFKR